MSKGGETHKFSAENDQAAERYVRKLKGSDLSLIKRGVEPVDGTLSRILDS